MTFSPVLPLPQLQLIALAHPQALARPEGGRFISRAVLSTRCSQPVNFCRSLRWCSFDVAFHFTALFNHHQTPIRTDLAAVERRSCQFWPRVVDGPHNFPSFPFIRGADGITIWPTGVLLTVCEHKHTHTANILSTRSQQRRWVVRHKAQRPGLRPQNVYQVLDLNSRRLFCRCVSDGGRVSDGHTPPSLV